MPKKPNKAAPILGKAERSQELKQAFDIRAINTVASLKDLRKATHHTQEEVAVAMGVGQGTVSRIEKRDDMLMSTLQHYVESLGGTLQIMVGFPSGRPLIVERLGKKSTTPRKGNNKKRADLSSQAHH